MITTSIASDASPISAMTLAFRDTCHHLASAVDAHVDRVIAIAGSPITHVAELLQMMKVGHFEWAVNEKVAAETVIGLSAAGVRSCLIVKHNGLDLALDPLMNAAVHTIGAGMIVISGDDPNAAGSTCIQDSRLVANLAGLPAFEPALDGDVSLVVATAVRLSEDGGVPVLIKVTPRMHQRCTINDPSLAELRQRPFRSSSTRARLDVGVAHGLTKLGRHQRHRMVVRPLAQAAFGLPGIVTRKCATTCSKAILSVGATAEVAAIDCCRMVVRGGLPALEAVLSFVEQHERVVVTEEPAPVLEEWLRGHASNGHQVRGRLSGHIRPEGAVTAEDVDRALNDHRPDWTRIDRKQEDVLPPGPWETLFHGVARLHRDGAFVATDVGSSVRLCYPPYSGADVALCLGSAISVAAGGARAGYRAIAVTGDFALIHSGLESLIGTTQLRLPVLVIVLANGIQAKTGGQPLPSTDIPALVRACGIEVVDEWAIGSLDVKATELRLFGLISMGRPTVAIVHLAERTEEEQ